MGEAPDFEAMYARDPDPFGVRSTWYERRKLTVVLASLCRQRYHAAWDPACGTGDLALALAERCARVVATDSSDHAVRLTAALTAGTVVRSRRHALPLPPGDDAAGCDLVVLSEVLYYLSQSDRKATYALFADGRTAATEVVAVNWRHHPQDAQLGGVEVVREFDATFAACGWACAVRHDDQHFVLSTWVRDRS